MYCIDWVLLNIHRTVCQLIEDEDTCNNTLKNPALMPSTYQISYIIRTTFFKNSLLLGFIYNIPILHIFMTNVDQLKRYIEVFITSGFSSIHIHYYSIITEHYWHTQVNVSLNLLIINTFLMFGGRVVQLTIGIPTGNIRACLLADLLLFSYKAMLILWLLQRKEREKMPILLLQLPLYRWRPIHK